MKQDYPPLFPGGFVPMTIADVDQHCVQPFNNSQTRVTIYADLQGLITHLRNHGLIGDLWIDGSFMTIKENPSDVDVVLCLDGMMFNQLPDASRIQLQLIANDPNLFPECDFYYTFDFPDNHNLFGHYASEQSYWRGWFGFNRSKPPQAKGIGLVQV